METPKSNDSTIPKKIDRYDLLERIGAGGMGLIFKGFDTKLKRMVAIKIISDRVKDASVRATIRERFFNEARAAGGLSHPNLVQIYDFNEIEGLAYIVMEFIEGETLDELIKSKGPLNDDNLMRIGREIASGLAFAHKKGIVHRDIKPSNIILEAASGLSKILDFGIAKFVHEDEMKLTSTGMVLGSTHYLSPEHIVGKNLDHRSDVFCLGTLLYEASTGILPFRGQNSSTILYKIVHFDPPPPSQVRQGVNEELSNIIMRCLKKDPQQRFQKGEDLEKELLDLQSNVRMLEKKTSGTHATATITSKTLYVRDSQLVSALQAQKKITPAQASALRGKNAVDQILREDLVSEDDLAKVIAECLNLPWIPRGRLRALRVHSDSLRSLPSEIIKKFHILPFFRDDLKKTISFVIDGSQDFQKEEAFAELVGTHQLQFYVGGRSTLQRLIETKAAEFDSGRVTRMGFGETGEFSTYDALEDRRILLIDNSATNQEALVRLFSGFEQNLLLCKTVDEAMQKIKREPFDHVWAQRNYIGDELQFETQILRQNPHCEIRYFENLALEIFQESIHYRKFREFFNRITHVYLNQHPKEVKSQALILASLAVKVAQTVTQATRHLDEVYFAVLFWKLDKSTGQIGKAFDIFDGIFRFRYTADTLGERFDGRGNLGLKDEQIPLASRVISALIPFESMKAQLEKPWADEEVNELKQKFSQYSGKQLDPRLTSAVLELLRPSKSSSKKTAKIAIVDSDTQYAERLAAQLKDFAAETFVYADGLAALAGIKKQRPDLIVSEVLVSKLDGFALCARLRSDEGLKSIPIVFVSESTTPEHSTKALQLGAEDYILKTQEPQFIRTKLERMIKKAV